MLTKPLDKMRPLGSLSSITLLSSFVPSYYRSYYSY